MGAGTYRERIQVQRRSAARDASKQPVPDWTPVADLWADIRYTGGLEAIKADVSMSIAQASIRVRYRTDITAGMRILHGQTIFDIQSVLPDLQKRVHVDLVCKTGATRG